MTFLNKLGLGSGMSRSFSLPLHSNARARTPGAPISAVGPTRVLEQNESTRVSNGLKEFLWNLDGLGRGALLDLGPAWQTTLSFFIDRGFRVCGSIVRSNERKQLGLHDVPRCGIGSDRQP